MNKFAGVIRMVTVHTEFVHFFNFLKQIINVEVRTEDQLIALLVSCQESVGGLTL